ncbi:MAG: hypothetical protein ACPG1A_17860 [Halioglobus sp.]
MLSATEFLPLTTTLTVVLWIEVIVYLGIGVYELVDDFFSRPSRWLYVNERLNAWLHMQERIGHRMHAGLCFVLGFVALNGLIEGQVSRFEIELIFVSLALVNLVIWNVLPPGRLAAITLATKPEMWLQIIMFVTCVQLIRPEVAGLCVLLNAWGLVLYFTRQRPLLQPFTYAQLRVHILEAEGPERAAKIDRVAGYESVDDSVGASG